MRTVYPCENQMCDCYVIDITLLMNAFLWAVQVYKVTEWDMRQVCTREPMEYICLPFNIYIYATSDDFHAGLGEP